LRDRLPGLLTDDLQCLACQARGAGFQTMHALVKRIGTGFDPLHRLRAPGLELVGDGRQLEQRLLECVQADRKSVVKGKSVSVRVVLGDLRINKKKKKKT